MKLLLIISLKILLFINLGCKNENNSKTLTAPPISDPCVETGSQLTLCPGQPIALQGSYSVNQSGKMVLGLFPYNTEAFNPVTGMYQVLSDQPQHTVTSTNAILPGSGTGLAFSFGNHQQEFSKISGTRFGFTAKNLAPCKPVFETVLGPTNSFILDQSRSNAWSDWQCHVQLHTTGGPGGKGIAFLIYPMGTDGKFKPIRDEPLPNNLLPTQLSDIDPTVQRISYFTQEFKSGSISDGLRQNILVGLEYMWAKTIGLEPNLNAAIQKRGDCLYNARTAAFSDLQAHYYCQMPLSVRRCFSGTAASLQKSAATTADLVSVIPRAYQACFSPSGPATSLNKDSRGFFPAPGDKLGDSQRKLFLFIMGLSNGTPRMVPNSSGQPSQTILGIRSLNIESEASILKAFYRLPKSGARPRRAIDVYPWNDTTQTHHHRLWRKYQR